MAASAGLRAFLPLLVVGVAGRFEVIALGERFQWMSSTAALTVLAIAVVVEVLGDKVPLVDHMLDSASTMTRPIAGAVVAAAPVTALEPLTAVVIGIILGGAVAGGVHAAKSSLRLVSTGSTAGLATPVLSVAEDVVSFSGSVVSLFMPVMTFTLGLAALFLVVRSGFAQRAH